MKKSFIAGAAAGASSLAVAIPLLAQMAGAQSASSAATDVLKTRPVPSQACVQALATRDASALAQIDTHVAAHKSALQARQSALSAAASITDDTARQEAVKAAHEAFRTAMEASMGSKEDRQADMEALKTACGDAFRGLGGPGMMGKDMGGPGMKGGHHGGKSIMKLDLGEKLGMTAEELKAELDAGKTIEDIAAEKGVELPARPEGMMRGGMMGFGRDHQGTSSETTEQ